MWTAPLELDGAYILDDTESLQELRLATYPEPRKQSIQTGDQKPAGGVPGAAFSWRAEEAAW